MKNSIKKLLNELEASRKTFWNISKETATFLSTLIKDRNYKTALEIGTSNGYSGIWLAEALSHTGGSLHTIESNLKKRFPLAKENFKKSGLKNIVQILGHAPEDIPVEPRTFDLAFFDATKCEHLLYWKALKDRINKGGCIITDNIHSHPKELKDYLETVKLDKNWYSEELPLGTGLLISWKKIN